MKYRFLFIFLLSNTICFSQVRNLDYFINQARQNSPVLKGFQDQLLLATLDSQLLRASLRTQVNGVNTNSYAAIKKGYGYAPAITNIANVSALVQANRNFF